MEKDGDADYKYDLVDSMTAISHRHPHTMCENKKSSFWYTLWLYGCLDSFCCSFVFLLLLSCCFCLSFHKSPRNQLLRFIFVLSMKRLVDYPLKWYARALSFQQKKTNKNETHNRIQNPERQYYMAFLSPKEDCKERNAIGLYKRYTYEMHSRSHHFYVYLYVHTCRSTSESERVRWRE